MQILQVRFLANELWGAPLLNGEEIVRRENDVVKANVEFRRSRVADNVSKVFDARIGDANRGDFP